jgi:hypothetical protein
MRIIEGGQLYNYCPGKATWNHENVLIYKSLLVTMNTGLGWNEGGVTDQPEWWVDLASDFSVLHSDLQFASRARAILGDGKAKPQAQKGNKRWP